VGALTLLAGIVSATRAYSKLPDSYGGVEVHVLAAGRSEVETALYGRRGTAAAYSVGFATLFLFVVLGPYRRGDRWSWWALLAALLVLSLVVLARIPLLGSSHGTGAVEIQLGVGLLALLLDMGRLKAS
jgi:hypothetical protein